MKILRETFVVPPLGGIAMNQHELRPGKVKIFRKTFVVPPLGGIAPLSRRFRRFIPAKAGTTNNLSPSLRCRTVVYGMVVVAACLSLAPSATAIDPVATGIPKLLYEKDSATELSDVSVRVKTDRQRVLLADPFELLVRAVLPKEKQVLLKPTVEGDSFGDFFLKRVVPFGPLPLDEDHDEYRWILELEASDVGGQSTGVLRFQVQSEDNQLTEFRVPAQRITVQSVFPEGADPHEIREIADEILLPSRSARSQWGLSLVLIGLAISGLIFVAYRSRTRNPKREVLRLKTRLRGHVEMAGEIGASNAHSAMVHDLRDFMVDQFRLPCQTMVRCELVQLLTHEDAPAETVSQLDELLQLHDADTFAGQEISEKQLQRSLDYAMDLIDWSTSSLRKG